MNYWLFKSEPSSWSWQDQLKRGEKGEGWDGVRNYQASNNMKKMKIGDQGFFYHSVTEKKIVGIVEVIKEYAPDPTDKTERFGMVTVKALKTLDKDRVTEVLTMAISPQTRKMINVLSFAENHENVTGLQTSFNDLSTWKSSRSYE